MPRTIMPEVNELPEPIPDKTEIITVRGRRAIVRRIYKRDSEFRSLYRLVMTPQTLPDGLTLGYHKMEMTREQMEYEGVKIFVPEED
jgi:hypothetical protein